MSPRANAVKLAGGHAVPGIAGRRLPAVRIAWVILVVIVLGLDVAGIPYAYQQSINLLAAEEGLAPGISREFYAAYAGAGLPTFVTLAFFAVAAVIFRRRSGDPMAVYGAFTLLLFGGAAVTGTMHNLAESRPEFWVSVSLLDYAGQVAFSVFFYVFPDGRFTPGWTRWPALATAVLLFPASFFSDSPFNVFNGPFFFVFIGSLLFVQVYRYRRVLDPAQRQQTKWVVLGSAIALVGFAVVLALGLLIPETTDPGLGEMVMETLIYGFILLVPLSIGVAILRYRLWDIDLVINRALVYGALTACVVGIYVLTVGYLGALFQARGNLAISLVATGIVAVLFAPLRARLQRGVNRLMFGERDDPYTVISRLGERLEATLSPEAVLPAIIQTVREALKLPYAAIILRDGDGITSGAESETPVEEALRLPLVYQGETIGELVLAPRAPGEKFAPSDRRLLDDLARQAGIAAHALHLTADLQRSRERLVSTREEERRRLRRDLHDGLGPMLGSLTLKLDVVVDLIESDPTTARDLIRGLKSQAQNAMGGIRRLVYALRPPALDDLGLAGAIQETAAQYGVNGLRVSVHSPDDLTALPAAVEVAAYRILQEGLTNVARHADATACTVVLQIRNGLLELEVVDNGRGVSPSVRRGIGMTSMRERAEEIGGDCIVESAHPGYPEGGTRVRATLPLPDERR